MGTPGTEMRGAAWGRVGDMLGARWGRRDGLGMCRHWGHNG